MSIFDFFRKSSAGLMASVSSQVGQPIYTPRNYDKLAQEGYKKNVIAYSAVNMIAKAFSSVQINAVNDGEIDTAHPINAILDKPNPMQSFTEFSAAWISYYLLSGNSYIEASWQGKDMGKIISSDVGEPYELFVLTPSKIKIIAGIKGTPSAYIFDNKVTFEVNQIDGKSAILHSKTFNPLNIWYGMSAIEAAALSIDLRNAGDDWNVAMLQNGAKPSGIMKSESKLTDQQFERIKKEIDDKYSGAANSGRPMLLEAGMTWQEMGLSPRDMDFLNAKNIASRDIALAFGVPAQLLGIQGDATYSNMQEARISFIENTVVSLIEMYLDELNGWLMPLYKADNVKLVADYDSIPVMRQKRMLQLQQIAGADFLTLNEKREIVGYPEKDGGDELLINSGLIIANTGLNDSGDV